MVLPDFYGFSNSVGLSQTGSNLRTDPKYSIGVTMACARRFATNYLLVVQPSLTSEDSGLDVSIDRICENNLHLKFTPLSITNLTTLTLARPKFSVEKSFGQFQFSAITDLASSSF
jgi:hypothetical protein